MSTNDWLAQLKEGDEVIVRHGYVYYSLALDVVERVTPAQVIVKGERGWRFRKSDGGVIGADNRRLLQPTQALRDEVRRNTLIEQFAGGQWWGELPLSVLEQVNAVLESHTKEGQG